MFLDLERCGQTRKRMDKTQLAACFPQRFFEVGKQGNTDRKHKFFPKNRACI